MKYKQFREDMESLVNGYFRKHPLAKTCGGMYISQNPEAQIDAIVLVEKICDDYMSIFESKKENENGDNN